MSESNIDHTQPVKPTSQKPDDVAGVTQPVKGNNTESIDPTAATQLVRPPSDPNAATRRMSIPAIETTQPVRLAMHESVPAAPPPETPGVSIPAPAPKPRRSRRWLIVLVGILMILLLGAGGGYLGYLSAQNRNRAAYEDSVTQLATEQFMLGLQAQSEGRYDLARQHIEYVIQLDPNFPGAQDKLAEIMLAAASAKTPTPEVVMPTITPSPTPDFRGEEEIFNNARALMANQEWFQALQVLDTLRNKNLTYRAIDVDGMYYVSLRNRGLININSGNLEEGLYDLAVVEQFGPLDVDAQGVRTWARLYITGSRFWGVRWDKVVEAFAEIYPAFPSLHDSSGMTATERFRVASMKYGDQLYASEQYCEALQQYQNAQSIASDGSFDMTVTAAFTGCFPPTDTPGPTLTPTLTETATIGPPVEGTTPPADITPTPSETPSPTSETPTS